MPELPEVETIKLQFEKFLVGHRIQDIKILDTRILSGDKNKILDTKILGIRRFAKVICIDLSNKYSILAHVKLTGQFIYRGPNLKNPEKLSSKVTGGVPGPHTHVIFNLDKGGVLYYNDVRRFGWIKIEKRDEIEKEKFITKLGPEPFRDLTLNIFREILSKTRRNIKVVLMDQGKMGGVGNIYANDALWRAGISPKRPSNNLKTEEIKNLYNAIITVLKAGLKYGGASELAFVTPDGREGQYQNHTLVYGHEGQPCERCHKSAIKKFFLGGRGTYVCPVCQV